jgi:multidrug efflux pump subunit AcrB
MNNIIKQLTTHKVAANVLMIMLILGGIFSINRLNTQFFSYL